MSKVYAKYKYGKTFAWIIGYSILFVFISALLNGLSVTEAVYVLFYQIFIYAIPGMAAILLLGIKVQTDVEWIGYSFAAGYCCNILFYYITVPFGLQQYIKVIGTVAAILSMYIIYKKRNQLLCEEDKGGLKICSIGVLCYALFMFVAYNGNGLMPDLTGGTDYHTYHRDVLYWIGNLNSLIKQYPPINPREYTSGIFNYHYFSSLQLAVQSLFTGVGAAVTCIGLYFYATVVMIVFGTYLFAKNVLRDGKLIVFAMCALLITSGAENITKIEQVCHYVLTSFGTDYGLGILLFLMIAFYRYCQEASKVRGAICIILLAVLTGTKGPYAAIAVCGFGGACLIWLIQRKVLRAFVFGGISLAAFGATYYFVCNTKGYSSGSSRKLLNLVIRTDPNMSMIEACLRKAGREIMNILLMKPVVILPLIAILIVLLCRRRRITVFEFGCLCMTAAGLAVNAIITMPSNQQTYFALAALVPAWCFVFTAGQNIDLLTWMQVKVYRKGIAVLVFALGGIGFLSGYTYNGNRFNVIYSIEDGLGMIGSRFTGKEAHFNEEYIDNGFILEQDEYEAMQILGQDEEPGAVILHILPEKREGRRAYRRKLIGSFSGKYIMNDEAAVNELLEGSAKEYQRLYDMGVRYILVDYWKEEESVISEDYGEEMYVGNQMKLYKLYNISAL